MKLGEHGWGNWMTGLSSFELGWDAIHLERAIVPFRERHIRASVYKIRGEINFGMFSISVIRSVGRKKASQCRVESDDWFIHQQSNGDAELLLLDKWELQVGFPPRVFLILSLSFRAISFRTDTYCVARLFCHACSLPSHCSRAVTVATHTHKMIDLLEIKDER